MTKLKLLSQHNLKDVPDHIIEEIQKACFEIILKMRPLIKSMSPNIALNAIQWANAFFIKELVTENTEELRKAAKWASIELIKNVETIIEEMKKKPND